MVTAILHNIRSIHNVGSVFRTADGLGVEKLYLTGYTPTPVDRFGRKREKFTKVALGAEEIVGWKEEKNVIELVQNIQENDGTVVACEPTSQAIDVGEFSATSQDICLVFGNEVNGLPEEVTAVCDQTVKVSMQGKKSSLNVAVAFGIISYRVIDKIYK